MDKVDQANVGEASERKRLWLSSRPWPVWAIMVLLLIQAGGLAGIGLWQLYREQMAWRFPSLNVLLNVDVDLFFLLHLFSLVSAIAFLTLRQWAWNLAMFTEGFMLLVALRGYWNGAPPFVYVMMGYGILMVLYLNYPDVRLAFRPIGNGFSEEVP